jgi:hydrogenase maturation protease
VNTVVLGLGNLLLADEGVGVHAAQKLSEMSWPESIRVIDAGTALLDVLPAIQDAERIIVVDAMKADGAPGSVYRLPFEEVESPEIIASLHGFDLSRVLALVDRRELPTVVVIGVEPKLIGWSTELTPEVADALPAVLEAVRQELHRCRTDSSNASFKGEFHAHRADH